MSYPEQARDYSGFRPLDLATLIYIFFELAVIAIFMPMQAAWFVYIGFYLCAAGMAVMFTLMKPAGILKAVRLVYPLLIITLFYEALDKQIFLIHGRSFDNVIVNLEQVILGIDMSFFFQRYMEIWLNEVMSFFYLSYYFIPPTAILLMAFHKRWDPLEKMSLAAVTTFFSCYAIFILFPVVGPRVYLESIYYLPLMGPVFTPLAQGVVEKGGLFGGAMPSSHCAVTLVVVWFLVREFRALRYPAYFTLMMLCTATVYGRFHYISDVVAGLSLGAACIWLTSRWQDRFNFFDREQGEFLEMKSDEKVGVGT